MRFRPAFLSCSVASLLFAGGGDCAGFRVELSKTYAFRPSELDEAAMAAKSKDMDAIWDRVSVDRTLIPCLEEAIEDPAASPSLRYDGCTLLVHLDPSSRHKAMQARWWGRTDLADTDPRVWVETLANLGAQGLDTREGATRWLGAKDAHYFLPEHGGWEVTQVMGSMFLFGSMEEGQAFNALKGALSDPRETVRDEAAALLIRLGTPESCAWARTADLGGFSPETRKAVASLRKDHQLVKAREGAPKTSRQAFLTAFRAFTEKDDLGPFMRLAEKVPDGERDLVAVLRPEDLPTLRSFRRRLMARCNPHALDWDQDLMRVLITLAWPANA